MLKKITTLFVLGIVALTMVACSNDEVTEENQNEETNNQSLEEVINEPVVELEGSEFHLSGSVDVDGSNPLVKAISVPEGSDIFEVTDGAIVVEVTDGAFNSLEISIEKISWDFSFEGLVESEKRLLNNTNGEGATEVIDIELPLELSEFDVYFYGEINQFHYHRILKNDDDGILIATIKVPHSIDLEEGRRVAHAIINSAQYE
ncbi:hypothetical protein BALCAV_0221165 [Alkalihalobacillus alcalophilus ATCC 27647 = CGMCC 1.3604]|uniref:Lipoprotein n=2 Tax=Alkalihalobacillus alcalophilus TaxID=1445 RepID=A0A094WFU0_ALKAL|nr:hypothetical protein [Alkalihalobacillus alcalophilus]KGA95641.1 hypothetical protein BALCAV_0221165 [Alkalihalobacillus alcalophilus ATCC 27647 = CGMCC 1.3604]MED1563994.1 hypothetical protein [Alkalihalobacillus alcalophilus]